VEQLAQDTFFKAAMFLQNYHPENSFVTWLTTIAYRTAIDYARSRPPDSVSLPNRVSLYLVDIGVPHPFDWPTPDPGTPELRAAVDDALDQLRPNPRQCVKLHVLEQRSYDEIAQELHLPVGTVKSHVNRAFKKLRALLGHVLDSSDPEKTGLLEDNGAAGEPAP